MLKRKMKRFVAFGLASVLALTPTMAFADTLNETNLGTPVTETGTGSAPTIVWEQNNETVFTVSTATNFNFVLDPDGISALTPEEIQALVPSPDGNRLGRLVEGKWEELEGAGRIIFEEAGKGGHLINLSTHALAFDVELKFTAVSSPIGAAESILSVGHPDLVTGTESNLFIGATFSQDNIKEAAVPLEDFFGEVTFPVTRATNTPLIVIEEAEFTDAITVESSGGSRVVTVERDKNLVQGSGNGTQFVLSGICNSAADWGLVISVDGGNTPADVEIGLSLAVTPRAANARDELAFKNPVILNPGTEQSTAYGLSYLAEGNPSASDGAIGLPYGSFIVHAVGSAREPNQQKAFDATTAANTARQNASNAWQALSEAYAVFDGETTNQDKVLTFEGAITEAEGKLGEAEAAFAIADAALTEAKAELNDDDVNLTGLEAMVGQLDGAINALRDKIAQSKSHFRSEEELAALEAAGKAVEAKGAVDTAISELAGKVEDFDDRGDEDALKDAIEAAKGALTTATNALNAANTALTKATEEDSLPGDHPDVEALSDAIGELQAAVNALKGAIDDAEDLIGPDAIVGAINTWVKIHEPATIIGVEIDGVWRAISHADINSWADGIWIRFPTPGSRVVRIFGTGSVLLDTVTVEIS